jgi:excisionase family DNA binding protein
LGLSKHVIYRLIQSGEIPHYKVGGSIRVSIGDFHDYVEGCRQG